MKHYTLLLKDKVPDLAIGANLEIISKSLTDDDIVQAIKRKYGIEIKTVSNVAKSKWTIEELE